MNRHKQRGRRRSLKICCRILWSREASGIILDSFSLSIVGRQDPFRLCGFLSKSDSSFSLITSAEEKSKRERSLEPV
eukprot:Gb_39783 [translate_table: standard]